MLKFHSKKEIYIKKRFHKYEEGEESVWRECEALFFSHF